MRINIFEGSRRVLLLLQISWAVGAILINWGSHSIRVNYQTISPIDPFVKVDSPCANDDRIEYIYSYTSKYWIAVNIDLCFKARDFDGKMYVPFKLSVERTDKGIFYHVQANSKYSNDVDAYVQQRKQSFQIPLEDEKSIEEKAKENLVERIKEGLQFAVGGWFAFWLAGTVIGWIIRGFVGIPRGMDNIPNKADD